MSYEYTRIITAESVYEKPDEATRAEIDRLGYEVEDFRPPKQDEVFYLTNGWVVASSCHYDDALPRFILRKKAKRKVLVCEWELSEGSAWGNGNVDPKLADDLVNTYPNYRIEERD